MVRDDLMERQETLEGAATLCLANAEVVTAEAAFRGRVTVEDGVIAAVEAGGAIPSGALDCRGELLLPGLVDLHTDHCERHVVPRPGVHWDPLQAAIAHDAQVAAAGITTVFDSLVVGLRDADQTRRDLLGQIMAAVEKGEKLGLFRSRHLLHLRHAPVGEAFDLVLLGHGSVTIGDTGGFRYSKHDYLLHLVVDRGLPGGLELSQYEERHDQQHNHRRCHGPCAVRAFCAATLELGIAGRTCCAADAGARGHALAVCEAPRRDVARRARNRPAVR